MMWFRLLVVGVGIWGISGCALQAERSPSDAAIDQDVSEKDKAAVQALFDQPYIDPLTRFLARPEGQQLPPALEDKVRAEQARRCEVVAQRYADRPLTAESLARYRAGYEYSCPDDVAAFAERVEEASSETAATGEAEASTAAETQHAEATDHTASSVDSPDEAADASHTTGATQVSPQQLNDCYLLTQIRNFSDALEACQEPAEKGNLKAQRNMAMMTYTLEDYPHAKYWAEKAASQSGLAASLLGEMYAQGQGVSVDVDQARHWFSQALRLGYEQAQSRLDALPTDSTP